MLLQNLAIFRDSPLKGCIEQQRWLGTLIQGHVGPISVFHVKSEEHE